MIDYFIVKIMKVLSWGDGEDGKLGHGDTLTLDTPKLIETLLAKRVFYIACGSAHSAAITSNGELYTWGQGQYGRLGHGDEVSQYTPMLVSISVYNFCFYNEYLIYLHNCYRSKNSLEKILSKLLVEVGMLKLLP